MLKSWNEFKSEHKGKGIKPAELSEMYKKYKNNEQPIISCFVAGPQNNELGFIDLYIYTRLESNQEDNLKLPDYLHYIKSLQDLCNQINKSSLVFVDTDFDIKGFNINNLFKGSLDIKSEDTWKSQSPSNSPYIVRLKVEDITEPVETVFKSLEPYFEKQDKFYAKLLKNSK